jgi:integrase
MTSSSSAAATSASPDRDTWHGRRDDALLLTAVRTGLRVSELTGLTIADTRLGDGPLPALHGKGRKERCTPAASQAARILRAWIKERGGQPEDPLLPSRCGTRLSRHAVARLVAVHAETAARSGPSIAGKHVTPHTLRHSTAIALLRRSRPPRETGRAAGGRREMHAQLSRERQATHGPRRPCPWPVRPRRPCPWPSVQSRRPPHRSHPTDAVRYCPWTPQHSALQRYKATHAGTEQKRPA